MEKIYFNYSLKNFPVPSRAPYKLRLIDKIESVIKRMRCKAHFFQIVMKETWKKQNAKLLD